MLWMSVLDAQVVAPVVASQFYWVFLALLFVNILQRSHRQTARKKRIATVYLALGVLLLYVAANLVLRGGGGDVHFLPFAAVAVAVLVRFRKHTFPFSFRCQRSGKRLDWNTILFRDSNVLPEAGVFNGGGASATVEAEDDDTMRAEQD